MVNFNNTDYEDWTTFRMAENNNVITPKEFELVCHLHSIYYKHNFFKPCTCSPQTINKWIKDLNIIWENGNKKS